MSIIPFKKEPEGDDEKNLEQEILKSSEQLNLVSNNGESHEIRYKIATILIYGYFGMFAFSFIFCAIWNNCFTADRISVMQVVPLVTTALGSPLGFVVAYYFNNNDRTYTKK